MKSFKQRITEFWSVFAQREGELRNLIDSNAGADTLIPVANDILSVGFDNAYFQLGQNSEGKYELILTPEGSRAVLLQLHYAVQRVPEDLKSRWNFYSSKPAHPESSNSIAMYDVSVGNDDIQLFFEEDAEQAKVNLKVFSPKLHALEENERFNLFIILLDGFIGELYTMEYVGYVDFVDSKDESMNKTSLLGLKGVIDAFIERNDFDKLENPSELFTSYQLEPNENEGWALREDVYIGITSCVPIINDFLQGESDVYSLLEKDGVVFGYLFYENINVPQERMVPQRSEIEDKIIALTEEQGIAYSIGGATGFHFSYMDFMIFDYEAFISIANDVLLSYDFEEIGFSKFIKEDEPLWFR